jgi:Uri superfamily endonuclease
MKLGFKLTNFLCAKMLTMLAKTNQIIPRNPGSYVLWLHLSHTKNLTIGKLGTFAFSAGDYIYLGSAHGPGGLQSRLGRHLSGDGKYHWHVDYLRAAAKVRGFGFDIHSSRDATCPKGTIYRTPLECAWSQKLATLPNSKMVVSGFGASDCQSRCRAHLIYLPTANPDQISNVLRCEIRIPLRE